MVRREDVGIVVVEVELAVNLIESGQRLAGTPPLQQDTAQQGIGRIAGCAAFVRSGLPRRGKYARGIAQVLYDDSVNVIGRRTRFHDLVLIDRRRGPERHAAVHAHQIEIEQRTHEFGLGDHQTARLSAHRSLGRHVDDDIATLYTIVAEGIVIVEKGMRGRKSVIMQLGIGCPSEVERQHLVGAEFTQRNGIFRLESGGDVLQRPVSGRQGVVPIVLGLERVFGSQLAFGSFIEKTFAGSDRTQHQQESRGTYHLFHGSFF